MKNFLLLMLMQFVLSHATAQTHYGASAGTLGASHSYFGNFAGNAAQSISYENSFLGYSSGRVTTTGFGNTAVGYNSLRYNTTGYWNTAVGASALSQNTTGYRNTAIGRMALTGNTSGHYNVAHGYYALYSNATGSENTAMGSGSLYSNSNGERNVGIGRDALYSNVSGYRNTATGNMALYSNTLGSGNTANGSDALTTNVDGHNNTATGINAMRYTPSGGSNSAYGSSALLRRSGSYNSAFGAFSIGYTDVSGSCIGSYNSAFGANSGPTFSTVCDVNNSTALGANARITASNQIRLGDTNVTSIGGQVSWSTLSDGRFKKNLRNDVAGLDFINGLNPVSYTVDKLAMNKFLNVPDSLRSLAKDVEANRRQIGFVAQDVEALIKKTGIVFSGIETPKNESDTYTLRYAEFVVPLVKAVQELTAKLDAQQQEIAQLKNDLDQDVKNSVLNEKVSSNTSLFQNNPNPFSSTTEINMEVPERIRQANLILYNLEGKQLKDIQVNDRGATTVKISGSELSPGMYLYTLIADGEVVDTKRLILTK